MQRSPEVLTVLFAIELFDTVASFVILTEIVLLLPIVKDGILVPGRSDVGVGTRFALQNVDCTQNDEGGVRNHSHRDAPKGSQV